VKMAFISLRRSGEWIKYRQG